MKKRFKAVFAVLLFSFIMQAHSQTEQQKESQSVLSFDTAFFISTHMKNGFGLGFTYERLVHPCLSLTGGFSTGKLWTENNTKCILVGISLGTNYYPLAMGLEKFYIGVSCSSEFLNYSTSEDIEKKDDTVTSITPKIGWKQYFFKRHLMLDFYTGYKLIIANTNNYAKNENLISHGFSGGIKFKLQ
ncbi:hypothetical protein [Treponema sp.]|uniref:hypothetical protein n=1 Tax=Treponema sp. TaxID=166 RepID=UPI003F0D6FCE